jgi:hypothetical protein
VRGPILARVDPDGIRYHFEGGKTVESPELDALIGDAGAVPLLVTQVAPEDTMVTAWQICAIGTKVPQGANVERRIRSGGEIVHRLDPVPLELVGGKKLACQAGLEKLPGGVLGEGKYRLEVAVVHDGEDLALGVRPFALRTDSP